MSQPRNPEFEQSLPRKDIVLSDGRKIVLEPLTIRLLPKLIDALFRMGDRATSEEVTPQLLMESIGEEILVLIEAALPGYSLDDLDLLNDAPIVLDCFLKQNLKVDTLKNWRALGQTVKELAPGILPEKVFSTK